ncbi:MAG: hypothetical protein ACHP8A_06725, partial [Terriglobales bacterium]
MPDTTGNDEAPRGEKNRLGRYGKIEEGRLEEGRLKEAGTHLARARDQFGRASVDSWEPADPAECVTKCFYSYENAVVAAATALGASWTKKH